MTKIRLGTCSPASGDSPQASLALLEILALRAAAYGVDLLLFPEAFLGSGYPRGVRFGGVLGADNAAGREAFLHYFQHAVDFGDVVGEAGAGGGDAWLETRLAAGDGTRETLERIARESGVFLVVGAIEKAGTSLYSAVVYVCPKQGILGKRRKVQPTGAGHLIWAAAGPASLRAVSTEIKGMRINLAAAVCRENYLPLVRQCLYSQNVNLYLAPTADADAAWLALVRTIGIEGRCFVVASTTSRSAAGPGASSTTEASAAQAMVDLSSTPQSQSAGQRSGTTPSTSTNETAASPAGGITTKIVECPPSSAGGKPRRRKKSFVYDEYGNEIVLACETVVEEGAEATNGEANGTENGDNGIASDAPVPLPPFPRLPMDEAWERHKRERRRSSVFDEDDNEIVLCCPLDRDGANDDQPFDDSASEKSLGPGPGPRTYTASPTSPKTTRAVVPVTTETAPYGGSAIVSPFGDVLAGPQWDDASGIILADVDFDDCLRSRLSQGHDAWNDAFKLSVTGLDLSPLPS